MIEITLSFDLPYPLHVEGRYAVAAAGEAFTVDMRTHHEENPRMRGAESVENISLVHEDTDVLAHTKVTASFEPQSQFSFADPLRLVEELQSVAIALANVLIAGVRLGFDEHVLEFIHQAERLGPVQFRIVGGVPGVPKGGSIDPLMGGITFRKPSRQGLAAKAFAELVRAGASA